MTGVAYGIFPGMSETQKITVEVPTELLARARAASGENVTATVRQGLRLVAAGTAFRGLRARRGKLRSWPKLDVLRADRG
jgi:hypothetical protein